MVIVNSPSVSPHSSADLWPAPLADTPVRATVSVGGSKSITNRALVIAALSSTPSVIHGALHSRDTELMINALTAMGADIDSAAKQHGAPNHTVQVTPRMLRGGTVECGLAGTVMRFVPPVAATANGTVFFDGDEEARVRPMAPILNALRGLGVHVSGDRLPFIVNPEGAVAETADADAPYRDIGGAIEVDSSSSSQFISGLLLAATRFGKGLTLKPQGEVPSQPHIDMTVAMLKDAGVNITITDFEDSKIYHVSPGEIKGRTWYVEPDLSNATPFLAAAAVTGGRVTVNHWPKETTQAGDQIRGVLEKMGCTIEFVPHGDHSQDLVVTGPEKLKGIDLDMSDIGELAPTVAAIATLASTPTRLTGIAHLRGHETNRLAALTTEINRIGGNAKELQDGIQIHPVPVAEMTGGEWMSYADHRMATAGAIIGLKVPNMLIENIGTTAKTMPNFDMRWLDMLNVATPSPAELEAEMDAMHRGDF
ncbi:3-phosphoshikimate 1-carboxyvinyltransferase [Corynebacterium sp. H78]|uniref:3-phosphoshikimate 1-carboxyvinyltransferase n=1 Tax=Corynebacterium sp. H78 TaxID=3133417 RepID=UPI00403F4CC8